MDRSLPGRLVGLQARLDRPYWGLMGIWAFLCGVLASSDFRFDGRDLLTVVIASLLVDLAWGSLWDLASGTDWFRPLADGWPPHRPAAVAVPPYTRPNSPGGRLFRGLSWLVGWWKESFWPEMGSALIGLLVAVVLAIALTLLLPSRLRLLNAELAALVGLGLVHRRYHGPLLAAEALILVGMSWLAGHLIFDAMNVPSLVLALASSLAVWGGMRAARGLRGGLWLQNGGQLASAGLLVTVKQPLAAGIVGMLMLSQVLMQLLLAAGADPSRVFRRSWPWLMAAMLTAALAVS
jgi:hypothetical protein